MIAAGALIVIDTVDLTERDPRKQPLHVGDRVHRHALPAHLPEAAGMIGVVAHQAGHVERRREAGLAVIEQVAEPRVGLLGRTEPGELAHRPQPAAIHVGVDAPGVGELAGHAD